MILSPERAHQIVTLAQRTNWDGAGMRDHMTEEEQARVTAAMFNARRNLSFNDCVLALAKGQTL